MSTTVKIKTSQGYKRLHQVFQWSVLICMGIIIISSLLGLHGAQRIFDAFDGNCIYTWKISFSERTNVSPWMQSPSISATTTVFPETPSTVNTTEALSSIELPHGNINKTKKIDHIFRMLQSVDESTDKVKNDEDNVNEVVTGINRAQIRNEKDYTILSKMQVDVVKTIWAPLEFCDYVLYNQVISSIAGMICTTMLIVYNSGRKGQYDWAIPKPWRIVFPAVIAFGIMSTMSVVYLVIMNHAYDDFCNGLSSNLESKTVSCRKLINAFNPLINTTTLLPGTHYIIHMTTIRLTLFAWMLAFLIMIARILLVIDFRLIRVTISTFSQMTKSKIPESRSSELNEEIEEKAQNYDKKVQKVTEYVRTDDISSKEDIDEFQSAHSDVEGATHRSSIDPLLAYR